METSVLVMRRRRRYCAQHSGRYLLWKLENYQLVILGIMEAVTLLCWKTDSSQRQWWWTGCPGWTVVNPRDLMEYIHIY